MKLERTLPAVWLLTGADVPALAPVASRAHVVVLDDVEYLCAAVVREVSRWSHVGYPPQTYAQMDEALGFLIGQVATLVEKYDPTKGRVVYDPWNEGFRAWLYLELKRDMIDECRHRYGREGHKHDLIDMRPYQHEEDNERAAQLDWPDPNEDGIRSSTDRLVESLEGVARDDPDDWFDGREWLDIRRDRKTNRQKSAVGLGAPAPTAGRDRATVEREEWAA